MAIKTVFCAPFCWGKSNFMTSQTTLSRGSPLPFRVIPIPDKLPGAEGLGVSTHGALNEKK